MKETGGVNIHHGFWFLKTLLEGLKPFFEVSISERRAKEWGEKGFPWYELQIRHQQVGALLQLCIMHRSCHIYIYIYDSSCKRKASTSVKHFIYNWRSLLLPEAKSKTRFASSGLLRKPWYSSFGGGLVHLHTNPIVGPSSLFDNRLSTIPIGDHINASWKTTKVHRHDNPYVATIDPILCSLVSEQWHLLYTMQSQTHYSGGWYIFYSTLSRFHHNLHNIPLGTCLTP